MSNDQFLESIGARIKRIRQEKNLTQSKLAELCDFEKASMSRIESGQTNPTILTLRKVSEALNVPVLTFFSEPVNV
jgi:transcriptional regulator with XRE-family HTH domain